MKHKITAGALFGTVFFPMILWVIFPKAQFLPTLATILVFVGCLGVIPYAMYLLMRDFSFKNRVAVWLTAITMYVPLLALLYGNHIHLPDNHVLWVPIVSLLTIGVFVIIPFTIVQLLRKQI